MKTNTTTGNAPLGEERELVIAVRHVIAALRDTSDLGPTLGDGVVSWPLGAEMLARLEKALLTSGKQEAVTESVEATGHETLPASPLDLGRLINSLPADVNKKLSLHYLKRVTDNYNVGPCLNCYGGHQRPCQWCGDSGVVTVQPPSAPVAGAPVEQEKKL